MSEWQQRALGQQHCSWGAPGIALSQQGQEEQSHSGHCWDHPWELASPCSNVTVPPWSTTAGVPETQPFPFSFFLSHTRDTGHTQPQSCLVSRNSIFSKCSCPSQAQGVWDQGGGECSPQLPSASGSSFLYQARGLFGSGAFIQVRFSVSQSIFMADVESCILGVSFLKSAPWVCSWPVLSYPSCAWHHLGMNELGLAEAHPLVRAPAEPRAVLGKLLEFPWALRGCLRPLLLCLCR